MTKLMSILCTWHSADADVHAWFVVVGADTWLHNDIMNYLFNLLNAVYFS